MKKHLLVLLILFACFDCAIAQTTVEAIRNKRGKERESASIIGIKGGVNIATMRYTYDNIKNLSEYAVRPAFGVFVEIPVNRHMSIQPEFMYMGRGMSASYTYKQNYTVDYNIKSNYADFRLLFIGKYPLKHVTPYIFAAPDAAIRLGGKMSVKQHGLEIPEAIINIGESNMKSLDFSVLAGAGVSHHFVFPTFSLIAKIEVGYNFGLIDTFSSMERDETAIPANVYAYKHHGERFNRGLEIMISLGIPLRFEQTNCYDFGSR